MRQRKDKLERKRAMEREFCLNHCPHAKDSDCLCSPKVCMVGEKRRVQDLRLNCK